MKKLMIIAAVVMTAVAASASSYNWKEGNAVYMPGTTTKIANDIVGYLFDAKKFSRQQLLDAFNGENFDLATVWAANGVTTAPNTKSSSGKFSQSVDFTYNGEPANTAWGAYLAIVNADGQLFIGSEKSVTASDMPSAVPIALNNDGQASAAKALEGATKVASGAAWYAAAQVPEPTSGLLLLLGVAGLALKRKRA